MAKPKITLSIKVDNKTKAVVDVNSLSDPEDDLPTNWDAVHDNEDGEDPVEEVTLTQDDFTPVTSPEALGDVLSRVQGVVASAKLKGLGGPLVASQMQAFTVLSVSEIEAREKERS